MKTTFICLTLFLALTRCTLLETVVSENATQSSPKYVSRYSLQNNLSAAPPFESTMIRQSDIYLGMDEKSVKASWGQPKQIGTAGNQNSKFQRWIYRKSIPTATGYQEEERLVFFEDGHVVGWETH